MELRDFIMLASVLLVIGLPLVAIYSTLKGLGWISRKGVMSDSFVIWITWLLSGLGTLIVLSIVDMRSSLSGDSKFVPIALVAAIAVSSISVFIGMTILSNAKSFDGVNFIFEDHRRTRGVDWRSVILVSVSAALALGVGIGTVVLVNAGYNHFFPPKDNPFTIYDA